MTIKQQLRELEHALRAADLWQDGMPEASALMSHQPFCVDTLQFEQWLQWVFIPKISTLVTDTSFNGLPNQSNIYDMATQVFKAYPQPTDTICTVIREIDNTLNSW